MSGEGRDLLEFGQILEAARVEEPLAERTNLVV
jgi:hypothetical protein